ncbi:1-deoxy-D-xylulose-5-phosphate synthase N-terminal domain-containing protein [Candidatus Omnitrophota bacterium]
MKLTKEQRRLRRRIIEISHAAGLSHLGSCLSAVDIICAVYKVKGKSERFILSCGHAGIALYAVLQEQGLLKARAINKLHVHPDRNHKLGIDLSTGSLGQGMPVALGMALADRRKSVYCLISDGECSEGSIWESLRVAFEQKLSNLKIIVNANGWGAYKAISLPLLAKALRGFSYKVIDVNGHDPLRLREALKARASGRPRLIFARTNVRQFSFLRGQSAHYYVMKRKDYISALKDLR